MKIGLIGLGKMGFNLALNMRDNNFKVIVYNRTAAKTKEAEKKSLNGVYAIDKLIEKLPAPRLIWLMISAGKAVDEVIDSLKPYLDKGDIIVDGGNSHYRDTLRRYEELKKRGINYADVGTSGGIDGARNGACMMIGAEPEIFKLLQPIVTALCVKDGYLHTGRVGSGHFVKMIHNGIEYGMLQAIAEGFEILKESPFSFDYQKIAKVWNNGSVIRGWLMELAISAFAKDDDLSAIKGIVDSSGEGLWTVEEALRLGVPAPIITGSLLVRYRSHQKDTFSGKVIAALRNEFGGHKITPENRR